jgi:hypothetical protein
MHRLIGFHQLAMKPGWKTKGKNMSSKSENKPVEKIRVGQVQLSIFRNESEKGPYFKAELEHSYNKDGSWHSTNSYSRRDLINLAKAAMMADSAIGKLSREESAQDEAE